MNVERTSTVTAQERITRDRRKRKLIEQRPYCSCSTLTRERGAKFSMGGIEVFKTSTETYKHSTTCAYCIRTEATTTVGLKMTYYGRLLANTVRATVSITSGAGGFSISPCLNFRALVSNRSPAFKLLDSKTLYTHFVRTPPSRTSEVCDYFESTLQQIYELFQDKVASPTDINECGETLIHVAPISVLKKLRTDLCD